MPATSVHFNGSVNLLDAETVMREISVRIPTGLRRMTEGETGERNYWIFFQFAKFAAMPQFEPVPMPQSGGEYERIPRLRLAPGQSAAEVSWPDIGYAAAYLESYRTFRRLQDDGTIPAGVRFQMQYPTPLAAMSAFEPSAAQVLAASYEAALLADLDRALRELPHQQAAVQWDVAVEIGLLAGGFSADPADLDSIVTGLARCLDQVTDDVPVGLHLCYGDYQHQHFVQPESLQLQVRLVNALAAAARRAPSWASFTVPQGRSDDAYFAPLRELTTGAETELAFALVPYHPADQTAGTTTDQARLIDTYLAQSAAGARDWAICTECGMGRVERDDVPHLLDLHREILDGKR